METVQEAVRATAAHRAIRFVPLKTAQKDEGYTPLFQWLREHTGLRAAKAFEKINVRMPSSEEASLLNISRSQPVVDMDRLVWAHDNTLFEYTHIIANAALHEYTYTYDIDEEASK